MVVWLLAEPSIWEMTCIPAFSREIHECKLVIELDGPVHDYQKEKDYNRDVILQELGLQVLHIRNEELENMERVKNKIINSL